MPSINLLPTDVVRVHEAARITKFLKVTSFVAGFISLSIGLVMGGYFFYKEKQIGDLNSNYQSYKNQVLSLESTENSLILVRDRLSKITEINIKYPYNKYILYTDNILNNLPQDVLLTQISGGSEKQSFTFTSPSSSSLAQFFDLFNQEPAISNVTIKSITYNDVNGYQIVIDVINI